MILTPVWLFVADQVEIGLRPLGEEAITKVAAFQRDGQKIVHGDSGQSTRVGLDTTRKQ